jgi:hypothetical protein
MQSLVRHNGVWKVIVPKPFEPERQTLDVAWSQLNRNIAAPEAYRQWYIRERTLQSLLYLK